MTAIPSSHHISTVLNTFGGEGGDKEADDLDDPNWEF